MSVDFRGLIDQVYRLKFKLFIYFFSAYRASSFYFSNRTKQKKLETDVTCVFLCKHIYISVNISVDSSNNIACLLIGEREGTAKQENKERNAALQKTQSQ